MPFRAKARALFKSKTRPSSDSTTSSSTNSSGSDSTSSDRDRYPSNVYRPDEPMPRPKYRLPPKKEHKEKLEAFSFADSWRRRSYHSTCSPMGTRAPSRANSYLGSKFGSSGSRPQSRQGSVDGDHSRLHPGSARPREGLALAPAMTRQDEQEGDDDVANVGVSRVSSGRKPPSAAKALETALDHELFSERDLRMAMQRSRLTASA